MVGRAVDPQTPVARPRVARVEQRELERRERAYRDDRPARDRRDCTMIVVDDSRAIGTAIRAALSLLRRHVPVHIVLAIPAAPPETGRALTDHVDEGIGVMTPDPFAGVGLWYDDVHQMTDAEVRDLLDRAAQDMDATHTDGAV